MREYDAKTLWKEANAHLAYGVGSRCGTPASAWWSRVASICPTIGRPARLA